ncbi:hypothetical protein MHYP_G00200090 [Metynnis hypsauchen]
MQESFCHILVEVSHCSLPSLLLCICLERLVWGLPFEEHWHTQLCRWRGWLPVTDLLEKPHSTFSSSRPHMLAHAALQCSSDPAHPSSCPAFPVYAGLHKLAQCTGRAPQLASTPHLTQA